MTVEQWRSTHEAFLPGADEAPWLRDLRGRALARLGVLGLPDKKVEAWKYTSTTKLARIPFVHDHGGLYEALAGGLVGQHALRGAAAELVFVNGAYAAGLSRTSGLPDGVELVPLVAAVGERDLSERLDPDRWPPHVPAIEKVHGERAEGTPRERAFDALNTALLQDGLVLRVPRGVVVEGPVHVMLVGVGEGSPVAAHTRLLIDVEAHASLTLVERHVAMGDEATLADVVVDAKVHDGGALAHHRWRLDGEQAWHVEHVKVEVGRDARYTSHVAWLGGTWGREDLDVRFVGTGGEAVCTGVTVAADDQHVDHHTWMRHDVPRCTSREAYKGVYGGRSRGVFNGNVSIAPDAQHTDADLSSRNLLLSDRAAVHAKPELVIHADDVKAAHGCTVGQLDPVALTYLRTRGIDAASAKRMLTQGFVLDLLDEIEDEGLRDATGELIRARLQAVHGTEG